MKAILKSVSRSFYLTIRFLPRPLREPVSLAYLLARATDTIADTAEIAAEFRLTTLRAMASVIAGELEFDAVAASLRDFASRQKEPNERRLIENLRACIDRLGAMESSDRDDIRAVLQIIVRGQGLDLRRFGDPAAVVSLQTAAELDEYTYLVAGCVGEFWTKLGFRHLRHFATRSPDEMSELGIEYGKGLQLINVLRDQGADVRAGRRYLPDGGTPAVASSINWCAKAEKQLTAGINYCVALTNWRIRFATVLPALIGARTLALLRAAESEALAQKIKVPRKQIRRILAAALVAAASPTALRFLFQRLLAPPR